MQALQNIIDSQEHIKDAARFAVKAILGEKRSAVISFSRII
jgi:hypothetical protein